MRLRSFPLLALAAVACGDGKEGEPSPPPPPAPVWLDELSGELPETMTELGLYQQPGTSRAHRDAVEYEPRFELWSNGTTKHRLLFLPSNTSVETSSDGAYEFPRGTLFAKTFSAPRFDGSGELLEARPLETRVLRLEDEGWQYAVYLWNEAGDDAVLADIAMPHRVTVEIDGERFEHVVPSKLDCRKCHESQASPIIGFRELGLTSALADGEVSQLEAFHERGLIDQLPEQPEVIDHADPVTTEVLGYLEGNCTHCHNGGDGASSAFDLRHDVALENLIGQETAGEALSGIRVVPGEPESSALYLALSRTEDVNDIQAMPPVGVQRRDSSAVELFRGWISSLPR